VTVAINTTAVLSDFTSTSATSFAYDLLGVDYNEFLLFYVEAAAPTSVTLGGVAMPRVASVESGTTVSRLAVFHVSGGGVPDTRNLVLPAAFGANAGIVLVGIGGQAIVSYRETRTYEGVPAAFPGWAGLQIAGVTARANADVTVSEGTTLASFRRTSPSPDVTFALVASPKGQEVQASVSATSAVTCVTVVDGVEYPTQVWPRGGNVYEQP
jgi:hypothetical protein